MRKFSNFFKTENKARIKCALLENACLFLYSNLEYNNIKHACKCKKKVKVINNLGIKLY